MKLTNNFGIPQTFMNVLARPTYNKGKAHLSATQLLNSPKIVALTNKFDGELEQDASDMVWSIFGSAVHNFLEHGKDDNHLVEERLHIEHDGWHISGAVDLQMTNSDGVDIRDYKTTSVWAVMNEKIEWELQLNVYAWLVEKVKNVPVTSLGIVAILRDWKAREKQQKEGYPEAPIKEVPIRLWTMAEREAYVSERISDPIHWHYGVDISGPTGVGALPNELKAWVLGYLKNNVPENLTLLLEKSMNSKLDDINLEFKLKHIAKLDKYHKMYMKDYVPELYNFLDSNYAFGQYYN